jgi:hypothetical protein
MDSQLGTTPEDTVNASYLKILAHGFGIDRRHNKPCHCFRTIRWINPAEGPIPAPPSFRVFFSPPTSKAAFFCISASFAMIPSPSGTVDELDCSANFGSIMARISGDWKIGDDSNWSPVNFSHFQ